MLYLFSNVMRPEDPSRYVDRLRLMARPDESNDIMVFMNACAPLLKCADFFCKFNLALIGRIDSLHGGKMWTQDSFSRACDLPCRSKTISFIDDGGNIVGDSVKSIGHVEADTAYPGINPTTGYMMWKWFSIQSGEDVSLVNFYGNNDRSTPMWEGHDYEYEHQVLMRSANMIFLEG